MNNFFYSDNGPSFLISSCTVKLDSLDICSQWQWHISHRVVKSPRHICLNTFFLTFENCLIFKYKYTMKMTLMARPLLLVWLMDGSYLSLFSSTRGGFQGRIKWNVESLWANDGPTDATTRQKQNQKERQGTVKPSPPVHDHGLEFAR